MRYKASLVAAGLAFGLLLVGCGDDSTGVPDLDPQTEFSLQDSIVETFLDTEIQVAVTDGGTPLRMERGEMDVEHSGGYSRTVDMEVMGDSLTARMMFFEPGEYRLRFHGTPMGHEMMNDMGEYMIEVHRQHHVIGAYWVEVEVDPAPVLQNESATVRVFVFDLMQDSTSGDPATGLAVAMLIHDPTGAEAALTVAEAATGMYEAAHGFGEAGLYELHVEIGSSTPPDTGEFHIPVLTSLDDDGLDYRDHHGGDGHGGHGGHGM
jgi:hypothetical protein